MCPRAAAAPQRGEGNRGALGAGPGICGGSVRARSHRRAPGGQPHASTCSVKPSTTSRALTALGSRVRKQDETPKEQRPLGADQGQGRLVRTPRPRASAPSLRLGVAMHRFKVVLSSEIQADRSCARLYRDAQRNPLSPGCLSWSRGYSCPATPGGAFRTAAEVQRVAGD